MKQSPQPSSPNRATVRRLPVARLVATLFELHPGALILLAMGTCFAAFLGFMFAEAFAFSQTLLANIIWWIAAAFAIVTIGLVFFIVWKIRRL